MMNEKTYKITTREEFEKTDVFGIGTANETYAQYFIGDSFLKPVTDMKNGGFPMFNEHLNRDVETTGISIMRNQAADRYSFVPMAKAGIRKKGTIPSALFRER